MKKQLRRQGSEIDLNELTLIEQEGLFSHTFGFPDNQEIVPKPSRNGAALNARYSRIISAILAWEDLRRFKQISYDSWLTQFGKGEYPDMELSSIYSQSESMSEYLNRAERAWIRHRIASSPNWTVLEQEGPWSDDPAANLIRGFLRGLRGIPLDSNLSEPLLSPQIRELWDRLLSDSRASLPGSFLPAMVVLAEGQTEEILLPALTKSFGVDLNEIGCYLQACGGSKQVAKEYLLLKEMAEVPIIVILDGDVVEPAEIIQDSLRSKDRLLKLSTGEMEDTFDLPVFITLLNTYLARMGFTEQLSPSQIDTSKRRVSEVNRVLRARGLGDFDKIEFATVAAETISKKDVPLDGKRIIATLQEIANAGTKLRF